MKKFINIIKGSTLLYILAIVSIGIASFITMVEPMVIRITIDSIIGNKPLNVPLPIDNLIKFVGGKNVIYKNLWICSLILVILTSIRGIFLYFKGKLSGEAAENVARNIRINLYDNIQNLPNTYHVTSESGDLIQRCTSDVETVRKFLAVELVEIGRTIFIVGFGIFMMLSLDKTMTVIAMSVVPIIFVFCVLFYYRIMKNFQKMDEQEGALTSILRENLTGVRVVKAFGRESFEIEKYEKENKKYRDLTYKVIQDLANYWAVSDFLCMLQMLLILISGVNFVVNGNLTLGTLVVFITYELILLWPIRHMGRVLADMSKMTVSLKRILKVLEEKREKEYGKALKPKINGDICFENVSFEYEKGNLILQNISFKAKKGEIIAVVGPTGSGKSSLVHLLLRLYDYKEGSITIDGIELKDIDRKWIRNNIGIVLQEAFLYSRSIKENIKIAKLEATDDEIKHSASMAAVHDVINSFEKGYDTVVGEKGVTLSGGQRQRVSIARALIKNLPILIFDDSLSAVDAETDSIIRRQIKEKSKGITTFIISHRISTVMEADRIIVLNAGKVENIGKHHELIMKDGVYRRIWEIQNSSDNFDNEEKVSNE